MTAQQQPAVPGHEISRQTLRMSGAGGGGYFNQAYVAPSVWYESRCSCGWSRNSSVPRITEQLTLLHLGWASGQLEATP